MNERQQLVLAGYGGQVVRKGLDARFFTGPALVAHVDRGGVIVPDLYYR
jgi:hypothetical protein